MACKDNTNESDSNSIANNEKEPVTNGAEKVKSDSTNVDQIIKKVTKINNDFESYSTVQERDTVETFNDEKNHLYAKEETNIIFSPYKFEMKIEQEQLDDSDYDNKEFYAQTGGIYLVDGVSYMLLEGDKWKKAKVDYTEEELQEQDKVHFDKQVEQYRNLASDEEFEETEEHYLLKLDLDTDKITENDQMTQQEEMGSSNEGYQVNEMDVTMKINKETLYIETITTNKTYSYQMDYNEKMGEMSVSYENIKTYKNQNKVKDIILPNDVLENAEEL